VPAAEWFLGDVESASKIKLGDKRAVHELNPSSHDNMQRCSYGESLRP